MEGNNGITAVDAVSSIAYLWDNSTACRENTDRNGWQKQARLHHAPHLVVQVESDGEVPHGRIRLPELLAHLAAAADDSSNNERVRIKNRCKVEKDEKRVTGGAKVEQRRNHS